MEDRTNRFDFGAHLKLGLLGEPEPFDVEFDETVLCKSDRIRRFKLRGFELTAEGGNALFNHLTARLPCVTLIATGVRDELKNYDETFEATKSTIFATSSWIHAIKKQGYEWNDIRQEIVGIIKEFLGTHQSIRHLVGVYETTRDNRRIRVYETVTKCVVVDSIMRPRVVRGNLMLVEANDKEDRISTYDVERQTLFGNILYSNEEGVRLEIEQGTATFKDANKPDFCNGLCLQRTFNEFNKNPVWLT